MQANKGLPVRFLPHAFSLLTIALALAGGIKILGTDFSHSVPVIDFSLLPDGVSPDNSYISRFYRGKSTLAVKTDPDGTKFLSFETNESGSSEYNGFDIRSLMDVPKNASLRLVWRVRGVAKEISVHLVDSPIPGYKDGEDWLVFRDPEGPDWIETKIRLSDFQRNDWQRNDAPDDGRIDVPLTGFDLVVGPGTLASIDFARADLTWNIPLFPSMLTPVALIAFALLLAFRSAKRLSPSGELTGLSYRLGETNYGFVLGNRLSLLSLSLAFLFEAWASPASFARPESAAAWGIFAAACVVGDFIPKGTFENPLFTYRFFPFFIAWWMVPVHAGPALATAFSACLVPAMYRRKRLAIAVQYSLAILLILFGPNLPGSPEKAVAILGLGTAVALVFAATELFIRGAVEAGLRRTQLLYDAVFGHSTDLIFTLSANRFVTSANNAFMNLTGIDPDLIHGMKAETFLRSEGESPDPEPSRGTVRYDAKIGLDGSAMKEVQVTETPIFERGAFAGILVVAADISERKKLEGELKRANALLEEQANIDSLTLIGNRRNFDSRLITEWNRAARAGESLGVLMIDVDYFKNYNDAFGHIAGDECLARIAKCLSGRLKRSSDFLARYGGEEFAVIVYPAGHAEAIRTAELLREAVEELDIPHPASEIGPRVTISVGLHVLVTGERGFEEESMELRRGADGALYEAKRRGRNRVCAFGDHPGGQ